jgi:hypothetical protein
MTGNQKRSTPLALVAFLADYQVRRDLTSSGISFVQGVTRLANSLIRFRDPSSERQPTGREVLGVLRTVRVLITRDQRGAGMAAREPHSLPP